MRDTQGLDFGIDKFGYLRLVPKVHKRVKLSPFDYVCCKNMIPPTRLWSVLVSLKSARDPALLQ